MEKTHVTHLKAHAHLKQAYALRVRIWKFEGVTFPDATDGLWTDSLDLCADHYGIFVGDTLVAAARLTLHADANKIPLVAQFRLSNPPSPPLACLSRPVVSPEFRGRGFAHHLDDARLRRAVELHARTAIAVTTTPLRMESFLHRGFHAVAYALITWGNQSLRGGVFALDLPFNPACP